MNENIMINKVIKEKNNSKLMEIILIVSGVIFLGMTARISVLLPFSPVPVTGQTFGVLLIGLAFGKRTGLKTIGAYLTAGVAGIPFFATNGLGLLNPSAGYLIGYIFMIWICGNLTEKGWGKTYVKLFVMMLAAETAMYLCGLIYLSFFIKSNLFEAGLYPFIIGDLFKMFLITFFIPWIWKTLNLLKK